MPDMDELSTPAVEALRRAQTSIIEHSLDRISASHSWYRTLPVEPRNQIEAVASLGVTMFVDSVADPSADVSPGRIFSVAPERLTGTITLGQTLALVRSVLDVVVEEAPEAVPEEDHDRVAIAALSFGRLPPDAGAAVSGRGAVSVPGCTPSSTRRGATATPWASCAASKPIRARQCAPPRPEASLPSRPGLRSSGRSRTSGTASRWARSRHWSSITPCASSAGGGGRWMSAGRALTTATHRCPTDEPQLD